ncbi:MAG: hypothetical protein R6U98_28185 [Pirellulaceae bacterium]
MIRMVSVIASVLAIQGVQPIAAVELHVAPNGAADANGTAERPLADLEQARDVIRNRRKNGSITPGKITVWVHGGDYLRQRSFTLSAEDSPVHQQPGWERIPIERIGLYNDEYRTK